MNYAPNPSDSTPADIGTSVHYALEHYVKMVYIEKLAEPSLALLNSFYLKGFIETFDAPDTDSDAFSDGEAMCKVWFDRTDLSEVQVLSVESKEYLSFPTSIGPMDLTYIFDRLDLIVMPNGKRVLRVVDYKTVRGFISADDVSRKIQCRLYAMAIYMKMLKDDALKAMNIDEVHVQLDLLRFHPVGAIFSVSENRETYKWMRARTERILAVPDDEPTPETISYGCRYCVRRTNCNTLRKSIENDSIMSLDIGKMVDIREQLKAQEAAAKLAAEEIDKVLLKHVSESNIFELEVPGYRITASAKRVKTVDAAKVIEAVGLDAVAMMGSIGVTVVDKLRKSKSTTDEQKILLEGAVSIGYGEAGIKIEKTGDFKP